jgi:hypothetical protein
MKTNYIQLLIFSMFVLGSSGCTYHNEEEYFNTEQNTCVTENISFANDIQPILNANCVSCHNATDTYANVNLSDFANTEKVAKTGLLLSVIKHETGFKQMPQGQPKLDDCTIAKIEAWVNDGFKNN